MKAQRSHYYLFIFGILSIFAPQLVLAGCCQILSPSGATYENVTHDVCAQKNISYVGSNFLYDENKNASAKGCIDPNKAATGVTVTQKPLLPQLEVSIPGFKGFSPVQCDEAHPNCSTPWLAEYIKGIYNYGLLIVGIISAIVIMIGGVIRLTAGGNRERIGAGNEFIKGSVLGLILALSSYSILFLLSPNLLILSPINASRIERVELDTPDTNDPIVNAGPNGVVAKIVGVAGCPGTGGSAVLGSLAAGLEGKVTYRYNGKGGPPPYTRDPGSHKCDGKPCETFCPTGQVCFDCSGFINHLLKCAGLYAPGGGTATIFSGAESVSSYTENSVNGKPLQAGDLVGWPKVGQDNNNGHVLIYIGNGQVAESHGGPGWNGNSMQISSFKPHFDRRSGSKYVLRAK